MCLAIPGCIETIQENDPLLRRGRVNFGGIVKEVSLACVPQAVAGQYVLVHVGVAISVVDEAEAQRVFDLIEEMEGTEELSADDEVLRRVQ